MTHHKEDDDQLAGLTRYLVDWGAGQPEGLDQAVEVAYEQLHKLATAHFNRAKPGTTLQPTVLINEVYLRLSANKNMVFTGRNQFFWFAGQLMRQIMVDYFRQRASLKRGGAQTRVAITEGNVPNLPTELSAEKLLQLDLSLKEMTRFDARQSRILELFYFAGLRVDDIAECMAISPSTVKRELRSGRHWLATQL